MKFRGTVGLSRLARLCGVGRVLAALQSLLMRLRPGYGRDADWLRRLQESRSPADQLLFGAYIGSSEKVREAFLRRLAALPALSAELKRAKRAILVIHCQLSELAHEPSISSHWWFKPGMELHWLRLLERDQSRQSEVSFVVAGAYLSQSTERCRHFLSECRFNPAMSTTMREAASAVEIIYAQQKGWASSERASMDWLLKGAACLAASIALVVISVHLLSYSRAAEWRSYTTEVGEHRQIVLPDHSIVDLNTGSEVRFKESATQRTVRIGAGEARFHPAKDATRPFVVLVDNLAIVDVGTQYNVRLYESGIVDVLVQEGAVSINRCVTLYGALQDGLACEQAGLSVTAGHVAAAVGSGRQLVRRATPGEVERREAWLDGRVMFAGTPLRDVVSEFNRYNRRKMYLVDASIADLQIGGAYDPRDLASFLTWLRRNDVQYSTSGTGENVSFELYGAKKADR